MKRFRWAKIVKYSLLWSLALATSLYIFLPANLYIQRNQPEVDEQNPGLDQLTLSQKLNSALRTSHQIYAMSIDSYEEVNAFIKTLQASKVSVYQHKFTIESLNLKNIELLSLPSDSAALPGEYYSRLVKVDFKGQDLVKAQLEEVSPDLLLKSAKDYAKDLKQFLELHQAFERALTNYARQTAKEAPSEEAGNSFKYLVAADQLLSALQHAERVNDIDLPQLKDLRGNMRVVHDSIFKKNQPLDLQYSKIFIAIKKIQLLSDRLVTNLEKHKLGNQQYLLQAEEILHVYNIAVDEYNAIL
jgi:hypothetical protein